MVAKQKRWRELAEVKRNWPNEIGFRRLAAICLLRLLMSL